ncbi:baeRF3 domain-containing protein [Riemerella anatipestifer]|uniref:baeRF3 domain-containing protein n=1 Tax=Riemerella anatipestifer TaxID=34085 RepID=UPI00129D700E|nr:hypothetical protein [Riemerella anatipestifer]MBT0551100.1 hypothetical protein [Riemerella anatipestifer]MBT0553715.1 hypothetical protein [Riemerella anatipestifer]MCU7542300.1 hypothetical protein [Riemerella anatipestifer]MCU7559715.1 hypothetical protein [Riemerella anatipestifer]MCW0513193.1 hypothetical protein [Riemerella anatipestifer]
MNLQVKLQKLASEVSNPCVTLSLNTHRTYPDNRQDEIVLKNLVREAKNRLEEKFSNSREIKEVLDKLEAVPEKINHDYNLDGLHIFISKDTEEIIKTAFPVTKHETYVDNTFAIRPLILAVNRSFEYLIVVLKKDGVPLYRATNDAVLEEIKNEDFPFHETPLYPKSDKRKSDSSHVDDLDREYFNHVDKAILEVTRAHSLKVVVISTEDNYSKLQQVADNKDIYLGHIDINYNELKEHQIAEEAYKLVREHKIQLRKNAIEELKEAISQSHVQTDLQEIYRSAIDGRAELLIIRKDYEQPVRMLNDREFELVEDSKEVGVEDDIISNISWEVLSKGGRVIFTSDSSFDEFGNIALKVKY